MMVEEKTNTLQDSTKELSFDDKDKVVINTAAKKAESQLHKEEKVKRFWFWVMIILVAILLFILFVNGKSVFDNGYRL